MLRLADLRKRFNSTVAVEGLSLTIERGEIFGLLGPNGAGKTTTIKMAVGLLPPDEGTVDFEGHGPPTSPQARRKLGVAPQTLALYDHLTGEENLAFFAALHGLTGRERRRRVEWALDLAGLADRRRDRAGTYSGGMKRRLNLALAFVHEPELVLLDEPTVGVDPQSRNRILETIERLRDDGCTVVYTTHYMEEAQRLCDRVGIVDRGKLLALDTVDALIDAHGGHSRLTVEHDAGTVEVETRTPLAELERLAREHTLKHFHLDRPNLEQVFLHLTGRSLRD